MRLLGILSCVCLVLSVDSAPAAKGRSPRGRALSLQDNSLVYTLFLRLMSNRDLRSWINQYIMRSFGSNGESFLGSQSINQNGGQQSLQGLRLSTPKSSTTSLSTPSLTIERDHESHVTKTTNTPPVDDLTIERDHLYQTTPTAKRSTSTGGYTIPIIKLTGPDSQKIVDPGSTTTVNLTVIRDYPDPGPTTGKPGWTVGGTPQIVRKKRSWQIPVVKLQRKEDYDQPGGIPPQSSLTDENGDPLVVVRDSADSQKPVNNVNKKPETTTISSPMFYYVYEPCVPNSKWVCFRMKYAK